MNSAAWSAKDWLEAVRVWRGYCSRCGRKAWPLVRMLPQPEPPLPCCKHCQRFAGRTLTEPATRWLTRCKRGVPLPDPFARRSA